MADDVWSQAAASVNPQQQPSQQPSPSGDVWSQAAQLANGHSSSSSAAPDDSLMGTIKNDAPAFLGNELRGVALAIPKALQGMYQGASQWGQQHPVLNALLPGSAVYGPAVEGIVQNAMRYGSKTGQDLSQGNLMAAGMHGLGTVTPIGKMYDQYQAGDMNGLADSIGDFAGQVLAGKLTPEAGEAVDAAPGAIQNIAKKAQAAKDNLPVAFGGKVTDQTGALFSALRPMNSKTQWGQSAEAAMPLMKDAEQQLGQPVKSINDLLPQYDQDRNLVSPGIIGQAKKNIFAARKAVLDANGSNVPTISGDKVADAATAAISDRTAMMDPGLASAIKSRYDQLRGKQFTPEQADAMRSGAVDEMESYYAKVPTAKRTVLGNDPAMASLNAETNAWKKAVTDSISQGSTPEFAAKLNRQYGSLLDIEDAAWRRKNVLERQAQESLPQMLSKAKLAGNGAMALLGIVGAPFTHGISLGGVVPFAQALAESKWTDFAREATGTNGLLERTFKDYSRPGVNTTPMMNPSRALPAPTFKGPQADTSGPIPGGMQPPEWGQPQFRKLLGPGRGNPIGSMMPGEKPLITPPPSPGFEMGPDLVRNIPSANQSGTLDPKAIPAEYNAPAAARYVGSSSDMNKIPVPRRVKLPNGQWQNISSPILDRLKKQQ